MNEWCSDGSACCIRSDLLLLSCIFPGLTSRMRLGLRERDVL